MISLLPDFLKGSYPPAITPFFENGDIDFATYESLIDLQIREGSHGIVVNGTSAEPSVLTIYKAVAAGNLAEGRRLHFELFPLNRAVFFDTNPIPIKYMAKRLGLLPGNYHRLPMMPATPEVERRLDATLEAANLLPKSIRAA
jgi:4-hydroxy-tetrahydrodipicolinate synthase